MATLSPAQYQRRERWDGFLLRLATWLLRCQSVRVSRQWYVTNRRPPNGTDHRVSCEPESWTLLNEREAASANQVRHSRYFHGTTLEYDAARLHQQLDRLIAQARSELTKRSDANLWRVGELSLRWRVGRATEPRDFAYIGLNPDGSQMKETA